ncbi:leucine-rich repeat domain-containing protein [Chryseolinea sp. T2]|uniref:leucine-rich repeat domain-containing protein n=1 Tax=Chryseolinea sp. T2 TaxID=3129255 RepID=UPI0030785115
MDDNVPVIENDVQDRSSLAWRKLCDYVDKVAAERREEFAPFEELGPELFAQIHTLPETIAKMKSVKRVLLYGSSLKRIPPEIGEMEALEYFDPYTSYDLRWFPYEITNCRNLTNSRVSTRALFGNFKNRMVFPDLANSPVRYSGDLVLCSVCKKELSYDQVDQVWISLRVGTDVLPLLANLCSRECESRLPLPPKGYVQSAHKGGAELKQPTYEEWAAAHVVKFTDKELEELKRNESQPRKILKLIRKLWDKN